MEHAIAHQIVRDLRAHMDGVAFAFEVDDVFQCEPAFDPRHQALVPEDVGYGDALALITSPLTKLLAYHRETTSHELAAIALGVIGERATVTHSGAPFIEISAAGVTKASGVAAVAESLGVAAADVIAFGDAPNDLPMLLWAGRAVAVANAHSDVKAVAGEHAPSNDDDGVADVIERLLRAES
jgi:hydroxymethylpyrimidine pyrophosphatase-like HAD family hydrolase